MDMVEERASELDRFVGEWTIEMGFADAPIGRVTFEWMQGKRFLVERWEVPHPDAPDGIAIIGFDEPKGRYLQHYFDSRGVARIYQMTFQNGEWNLWRETPDFSPLDFKQRFTGSFGSDGGTITGLWEICDDGSTWEQDFELTYRKVM